MSAHLGRIPKLAWILVLLILAAAAGGLLYLRASPSRCALKVQLAIDQIAYGEFKLQQSPEGYWTGDIAELHRMGLLTREIAEADAAPIHPLVTEPKPFCGYFFINMKSGQAEDPKKGGAVPLNGSTRSREGYGVCIYPAQGMDSKSSTFLVGPHGKYISLGVLPRTIDWPAERESMSRWAIMN